jgi:hypothetical protein
MEVTAMNTKEVYSLYRITKNGGLIWRATYSTYGAAIIEKTNRMSRYPGTDYSIKTESVKVD